MNTVIDFFYFNGANWGTILGRTLVLMGLLALLIYIFNFVWLLFYDKFRQPSFCLYADKGLLMSLIVAVLALSAEWYFLISANGIQWFKWRRFPIDFHNTYLMILPELCVSCTLFVLFFMKLRTIKKKL